MPPSRRDHLVNTALDLFYQHGFHATGIDKILAESGVAKMTLYKHFRSKNELILAVLEERDLRFRDGFVRTVESKSESPEGRLLAVFDALGDWFSGDFHGCLFIKAAAEFANSDPAIHKATGRHKVIVREYIQELAQQLPLSGPAPLAYQLSLLVEGAIVVAHVCEDNDSHKAAQSAAKVLIEKALAVSAP